jgi:hypothetical protein
MPWLESFVLILIALGLLATLYFVGRPARSAADAIDPAVKEFENENQR